MLTRDAYSCRPLVYKSQPNDIKWPCFFKGHSRSAPATSTPCRRLGQPSGICAGAGRGTPIGRHKTGPGLKGFLALRCDGSAPAARPPLLCEARKASKGPGKRRSGPSPGGESAVALLGWHYLSNATCLIRSHLLYACFILSRIIVSRYMIHQSSRTHALDT